MKKQLGTQPLSVNSQKTWVQTERAAHEAWAKLAMKNSSAAGLMHVLVAQMGEQNAVVASRAVLAKLIGTSETTVKRAVAVLKEDRWIEVVQLGGKGGVNAYVINKRVAWQEKRDKMHFALFDAAILADIEDQGERGVLEDLRRVPVLYDNEEQLPSGKGEDPPAQPLLDGIEPDLPARRIEK
jgi:hypothetical protein